MGLLARVAQVQGAGGRRKGCDACDAACARRLRRALLPWQPARCLRSGSRGRNCSRAADAPRRRRQVKAKVNEIDTTKVKETLARTRDSATETLTQARMFSESQLQETTTQARQLADRQAKQLSKVNAKSLLNSHANFGVPIEALAYRDENGVPCDDVSVPKPLNMMITYLESSPPVGAGAGAVSALFAVSASSAAQGVPALVKAMDTHIAEVDLSLQTEPAVVAALLRQWLVDLPEPLLTHGLYDAFTKAYRSEGQKEAMIEVSVPLFPHSWQPCCWATDPRVPHTCDDVSTPPPPPPPSPLLALDAPPPHQSEPRETRLARAGGRTAAIHKLVIGQAPARISCGPAPERPRGSSYPGALLNPKPETLFLPWCPPQPSTLNPLVTLVATPQPLPHAHLLTRQHTPCAERMSAKFL